jgi:hypothetical protein
MTRKKLIEFGWDEPDTAFMRGHVAEMRATPFDGCVFHVNVVQDGATTPFTWHCWGTERFDESAFAGVLDDLNAGHDAGGFPSNFLRFNVTPGDVDWFDDFGAILHNAEVVARIARLGHCEGLLFDIEQYNHALFFYPKLRDAATKSWDVYAAQVRRRGAEVMTAFQKGFPNLKVFLTVGYCLPWYETRGGRRLDEVSYGLLAPFLDGMVDACDDASRLVDGHESSYGYREPAQLDAAYRLMREELLPIVADAEKYRRVFSLGFGLWLDHDWRRQGWDTQDFSKNHHQPEQFGTCLRRALEVSDEYVWIYTETPRWWSNEGAVKLPQAYVDAIRAARG